MYLIQLLKADAGDVGKWRDIENALARGADPNEICQEEGIASMHLAAGLGERAVRILLQHGGRPNVRALDGTTPLHVAASWGDKDTVMLLLLHGADINLRDENENTPYDLAFEANHHDCASILCMQKKREVSRNYNSPCSPCTSPQTITQKLFQYLEKGTPFCLDATSPDTPVVSEKRHNYHYAATSHSSQSPIRCGALSCSPNRMQRSTCLSPTQFERFPSTPPCSPQCQSAAPQCLYSRLKSHSQSPHQHCYDYRRCSQDLKCCSSHHDVPVAPVCLSPKSRRSYHRRPFSPSCSATSCCELSSQTKLSVPLSYTCGNNGDACASYSYENENHGCRSMSCKEGSSFDPTLQSSSPKRQNNAQPQRHFMKKHNINQNNNYQNENTHSCDNNFVENLHAPTFLEPKSKNLPESRNLERYGTGSFSSPSGSTSSHYTSALTSASSPRDKVAAYVLSTLDFMGQCSVQDNASFQSAEDVSRSIVRSSLGESESSENSFATCSDGMSIQNVDRAHENAPKTTSATSSKNPCHFKSLVEEKEKHFMIGNSVEYENSSPKYTHGRSKLCKAQSNENPQLERHEPYSSGHDSLFSTISKPQNKMKLPEARHSNKENLLHFACQNTQTKEKPEPYSSGDDSLLSTISKPQIKINPPKCKNLTKENLNSFACQNTQTKEKPEPYFSADDSLLSTISTRETLVKDEQSGIVFIEKHTPSVTSGSVGRRSLDSIASSEATYIYDWKTLAKMNNDDAKATPSDVCKVEDASSVSSVGTFIYDWKTLGKMQKNEVPSLSDMCKFEDKSTDDTPSHSSDSQATTVELAEEVQCVESQKIVVPDHFNKMSCKEISDELRKYGEMPGPVVPSTRQVYLRRLTSLEANPGLVTLTSKCPDYPPELRQALEGRFDNSHLPSLEMKMVEEFGSQSTKQWREGREKSSFTYLLLDPRVTDNLPLRAKGMSDLEVLKTFICGIFYIGKGKRARPYCHLHEAVRHINKKDPKSMSKKVQQVVDIWRAGLGVVSLHCFQSVIPVEAYTREACMIEAMGIHKLTNMKRGEFYGVASTWSMQLRRQIGVYLLTKALQIFLAEGERQICLPDIR